MSFNNNDGGGDDRSPPGSGGFRVSSSGGDGSQYDGFQAGSRGPPFRSVTTPSSLPPDSLTASSTVPLVVPTTIRSLALDSPVTIVISSTTSVTVASVENTSTAFTTEEGTWYPTPTDPLRLTPFPTEQPSFPFVEEPYSSTTAPLLAVAPTILPTTLSTATKAISSSLFVGLAVSTGSSALAGSNAQPNPSLLPDSHQSGTTVHRVSTPQIVAAVLLPLVIVSSLGALIFLCLRRRRRQKASLAGSEKKIGLERDHPTTQHAVTPQAIPRIVQPSAPQPVILSPNMNSAYFTGIDTSDAVSMPDGRVSTSGYSYDPGHGEEPPPPYRPRSLAPAVSRDSSVRQAAPAGLSRVALMDLQMQQGQTDRNPFEDDAISEISDHGDGQSERGAEDRFSEVSDLSYQDEPTTAHHTI